MTDAGETGADLAITAWVALGKTSDSVTAKARSASANVVNNELSASWSESGIGPLRYNRTRDVESASSFSCELGY